MEFSALNVDFNGVSFYPLDSRSPPYECIKFGYTPFKTHGFCYTVDQSNNRTVADRHADLLRIITSTADELSGGTNIDDLERP